MIGRTRIALIGAALLAFPANAADEPLQPASGAWLVATFRSVCVDPFGDEEKVRATAESAELGFTPVLNEGPLVQPGSGWRSPRAALYYSSGEGLPRDLPSPQCSLTALAETGYDHAATAAALESALSLPPGKTRGKNGRFQTEWNLAGPGTNKRKIFLSAEPGPSGTRLRLSHLNLRK